MLKAKDDDSATPKPMADGGKSSTQKTATDDATEISSKTKSAFVDPGTLDENLNLSPEANLDKANAPAKKRKRKKIKKPVKPLFMAEEHLTYLTELAASGMVKQMQGAAAYLAAEYRLTLTRAQAQEILKYWQKTNAKTS